MTSAVYVAGKLVAPGDCPICGGKLHAMICQSQTCGRQFSSLYDLQNAYSIVELAALAVIDALNDETANAEVSR